MAVPVPADASALASAVYGTAPTRLRRPVATRGPRCPDCAGPLVFGEGCELCPVCGYSACESAGVSRS